MELTRTIYHFEDEPETLYWVFKNLRTHYRDKHPEWEQSGSPRHTVAEDESVHEAQFEIDLHPSSVKVKVRHWMCNSADTFSKECDPRNGDIVLLDAMRPSVDGTFTPDGLNLFSRFVQKTEVSVYLFTGYEQRARSWIDSNAQNLPKDVVDRMRERMLIKPVNVPKFIEKLASLLELESHVRSR